MEAGTGDLPGKKLMEGMQVEIRRAYAMLPLFREAVLERLARVDPGRLDSPTAGGKNSALDIIAHLMAAEDRAVNLLSAGGPAPDRVPFEQRSLTDLRAAWTTTGGRAQSVVRNLGPAELRRQVADPFKPSLRCPVERLLWHAVAHEFYHLGQLSLILRGEGIDPPEFDLLEGLVGVPETFFPGRGQ